jgi:hypothetical protein
LKLSTTLLTTLATAAVVAATALAVADRAKSTGTRLAVVLTQLFDGRTTAFLGLFLSALGPRRRQPLTTEWRTR